jgi:hypothetical protein
MFVAGNVHDIGKPKNLSEFNRLSSKYVDYYFPEKEGYPSVVENVINVPMSKSQVDTYRMFEARLDPNIRYKMKKNLPLDKQESSNLNAFINAQRQITNTERGFNVNSQSRSPKTMEVVDRIQIGKGKALVYSNYLESGIKDIVGELGDRQISSRVFTGKLTRREKDEIIRDYNADKFKVLVVSSSGGEGLDLKGTRQVHVLEPHWNEEKIQQVIGRAVRYKSHEALPPNEQNVEIYRYISTFPKNIFGMKSGKMTADEYLTNLSRQKKALNEQFLGLYKKDAEGIPCGKGWISPDKRCKSGITGRRSPLASPSPLMEFQLDPDIKRLRSLTTEKNRIRHNKNESAVIVNDKTGEVVYRGREGTPAGCDISDVSLVRGNTVLHNHPTPVAKGRSNSFSEMDIGLACTHGANEILAVNERYEYSMKPPKEGWSESFYRQQVHPSFQKHRQDVQKEVVKRIFSGEWRVDWLGRLVAPEADPYHEIWERVAKDTGMVYTKTQVFKRSDTIKRVDSSGTAIARTPLEQEIFQVIQRIYPARIVNLKAIAESPTKVTGGFIGLDRKVYLYELDLVKKTLEYGLNQYKTPQGAFRFDAKRKDPSCKESIPCQGEKGIGCVSRKKKCQQRLNRIASPAQQTKISQLAQEEFGFKEQEAFKKQLNGQGIRELRLLAKNAGVGNYGNQPKEVLVNTLTHLKELETTSIQSKGKYGEVKSTSSEDVMRRALTRREEQRKNNLYVAPIDPSKIALTKEQIAAKRLEEDKKRRRGQAAKRAASALFPGASKVVEEFVKASTIDDKAIATLVAGVFALRMYGSAKSEFQNNYRKGIEEQADTLYDNPQMIGEKEPGEDIRALQRFYEKEGLSEEEARDFVSGFTTDKGASLSLPSNQSSKAWKDTVEMSETGGAEKDDLLWQVADQKRRLRDEASSEIRKAEALADKQDRKYKTQSSMLKQMDDLNTLVRQRIADMEDQIKNAKPEDRFELPAGLITKELEGYVDGSFKSASIDERRGAYVKRELEGIPGLTDTQKEALEQKLKTTFNQLEAVKVLNEPKTRTVSLEEFKAAKVYLENVDKNNFTSHRNKLRGSTSSAKEAFDDAQQDLESTRNKWSFAIDSTDGLEKEAKKRAIAEIDRRRDQNIKPKPLFPDFGKVKDGKLSRYQAWVMAKYTSARVERKSEGVLAVNNAIRNNPQEYSLEQFKKELSSAIVVGSETGKAAEAIAALQKDSRFKNVNFIPVENDYSLRSSLESTKAGNLERKVVPYIGRLGRYIKKAIPANNRIPGLNPTKPDNADATRLASKIIALQRYGMTPKIIAQGVGGSILQEALDIVAASKDGRALDSARIVNLGVPKLINSPRKKIAGKMSSFYGEDDFLAKNFGGYPNELLPGVKGARYKDYLASSAGMEAILKLFT